MTETLPATLRTLAVVQAGGAGSRMESLTQERAKPAMPVAGTFSLIDFPLSVLAASGISDVWVSVQFQSSSMDTYLAGGRPWDLDRSRGGFRLLTPEEGSGSPDADGFSRGNADGLYRVRDDIRTFGADVLLILSVDLRPVIARHLARGAECTLLTAEVGVQEATHQVVVSAGADGRVRGVESKPSSTTNGTVASEIFLYDPTVLVGELERLHSQLQADGGGDDSGLGDGDDTGLGDFAEHLLPALIDRGRVFAEPLPGYWKDLGRPEAYLQAHRDLLAGRVDVFDHPDRPIRSAAATAPAAWFGEGAELQDAMVSPGARVRGRVHRSVLGPGVEIQAGAVIEDSVLLGDTLVEAGARVRTAIIDTGVRIGRDVRVGDTPAGTRLTEGAVTLVGKDSQISPGTALQPGARLDPGATAD